MRLPESWTHELIQEIRNLPEETAKAIYLKEVFLEKFVSSETEPPRTRRARAIAKWLAAERDNEATNVRLLITPGEYNILPRVKLDSFVEKAREFIESVIGAMPEDADLIGGFSGGASTSKRRTESHPASKFLGLAHITADAQFLWDSLFESLEGWYQFKDDLKVRVVPGNVLFTVPKNADIDRVACKEPDINMFMQKGMGSAIRRHLRRVGIDLNDQTKNKRLARLGSIDGSLATLDLSSASDSVTSGLVRELLPPIWFTTLNALRSEITIVDEVEHRNEMFSSMGNGFTFELESLLFYALARTTAYFRGISGIISVYGDDIICPTDLAQDLTWVLGFFGFQVNTKKSFVQGPFRESCGGHFFNGLDVTPFYLRAPISKLTDLIHIANAIRYWASERGEGCNDPTVYPLWRKLRDRIPRSLWGGREYSSITQLVSPDRPRSVLKPKRRKVDTGVGGYIHWLCATNRRNSQGELETSSREDEYPVFRRAKASRWTVTQLPDYFCEEVVP